MFISVLYQITYRPTASAASAAVSQFTHRLLFPSLTADPFLTHSCASFLSLFLHLSSFYSQSLLSLALSFFFSLSIFLSLSLYLSFSLSPSFFILLTISILYCSFSLPHSSFSQSLFLSPSFLLPLSLSLSLIFPLCLSVFLSISIEKGVSVEPIKTCSDGYDKLLMNRWRVPICSFVCCMFS